MELGGEVARALRSMRCVLHPLGSRRFIRCTRSQHTGTLIFMLIFCCLLSNNKLWTEKLGSVPTTRTVYVYVFSCYTLLHLQETTVRVVTVK